MYGLLKKHQLYIFLIFMPQFLIAQGFNDCYEPNNFSYDLSHSANDNYSYYDSREYTLEKSSVCRILVQDLDRDVNNDGEYDGLAIGTGVLITDNTNSNYFILTAAHVVILDYLDFNSPLRPEERYWGNDQNHRYHLYFNYIQDNSSTDVVSSCLSFADTKGELVYVNTRADIALIKITDDRIINSNDISVTSFWNYWDYDSPNDYITLHHPLANPMKVGNLSNVELIYDRREQLVETTNLTLGTGGGFNGKPADDGSSGSPLINKKNHAVISVMSGGIRNAQGMPIPPYHYINTELHGNQSTNGLQTRLSQILKINSQSSMFKGLPYWATPAVVKKDMTLSHFDNEVTDLNVYVRDNSKLEIKTKKIRNSNFYYSNGCMVMITHVDGNATTINPGTSIGPVLPPDSGSERQSDSLEKPQEIKEVTKNYLKEDDLKVFPNPAYDDFTIQWEGNITELKRSLNKKITITIFNKMGQIVYMKDMRNPYKDGNNTVIVQIPSTISSKLNAGVYHVITEFNNKKYFKKLIKH